MRVGTYLYIHLTTNTGKFKNPLSPLKYTYVTIENVTVIQNSNGNTYMTTFYFFKYKILYGHHTIIIVIHTYLFEYSI